MSAAFSTSSIRAILSSVIVVSGSVQGLATRTFSEDRRWPPAAPRPRAALRRRLRARPPHTPALGTLPFKTKAWLRQPPTEKQLQHLPAEQRQDYGLTRYRASALITFQFNRRDIRRLVMAADPTRRAA
jgi:hypothetical protein